MCTYRYLYYRYDELVVGLINPIKYDFLKLLTCFLSCLYRDNFLLLKYKIYFELVDTFIIQTKDDFLEIGFSQYVLLQKNSLF